MTPMRILVADEQPKVRFALRVLLARQDDCSVIAETGNAEEMLAQAEVTQPDLILLGWELPGLSAAASLDALHEVCPKIVVIALSAWPEARQAALGAGADAFVSKADPPERLLQAINACGCGPESCL